MNEVLPQVVKMAPHFKMYHDKAQSRDVIHALESALKRTELLYGAVSEDRGGHRYAVGKWSIKEVLQHLSDCERIFAYRALCFARQDPTALPGFDEDLYGVMAMADRHPVATILAEHCAVRQSTLALFASFDEAAFQRIGTAGSSTLSVHAQGLIIAGHAEHHCDIHEQRYL